MTKFNFTRGKKTPKGKPKVIRMITKEHDAYKIYLRGQELRKVKGLEFSKVLTEAEVKEATESLKNEKEIKTNAEKAVGDLFQ